MITILSTNIGRGHPFYVDGVAGRLARLPDPPPVHVTDVFAESDTASRLAWSTMRALYRRGGAPGIGGMLYRLARGDAPFDGRSLSLRLAGRGLRSRLGGGEGALLVDHPILVAILQGRSRLAYQHGEVIAPAQSIVRGASCVYVPTRDVADAFVRGGYRASDVVVTGLCVEMALADGAEGAAAERRARLRSEAPLVAGFFSSGAEPPRHVEHLVVAARSLVARGGKGVLVAARGGRLQARARAVFGAAGIAIGDVRPGCPADALPRASLVLVSSRSDLEARTAEIFGTLDLFAAPPHERTAWALGLGLPMAIVGPDVGPFAPLNRRALIEAGVAIALDDRKSAEGFGAWVNGARTRGELQAMSDRGYGRHPVDGFGVIARHLAQSWSPGAAQDVGGAV